MSASQYKSGENTEMYVHIVNSILSICQKFVDSSIYGGLIPIYVLYCLQANKNNRFVPRGTKYHWVNP